MPRPPAASSRRAPPAPPPQTFNECLACGEPATLRCAACLQKGSIELFFCSKEHQKLIWPVHRMFCGERAHPIRMPPFSQKEADTIRRLIVGASRRANPDAGRNLVNTVLGRENTHRVSLKDEQKAEAMVLNFVGKDCRFGYDMVSTAADPDGERINLLRLLRTTLFELPRTQQDHVSLSRRIWEEQANLEPVDHCFMLYSTHGSTRAVDQTSQWFSHFCHRVLAQSVLRDMISPGVPDAEIDWDEMDELRRKSLQSLERYLRTTRTKANRAFVRDSLRRIVSYLERSEHSE